MRNLSPRPRKKVKKPKKGLFDRTIGGFLDKVFSEDGIDD